MSCASLSHSWRKHPRGWVRETLNPPPKGLLSFYIHSPLDRIEGAFSSFLQHRPLFKCCLVSFKEVATCFLKLHWADRAEIGRWDYYCVHEGVFVNGVDTPLHSTHSFLFSDGYIFSLLTQAKRGSLFCFSNSLEMARPGSQTKASCAGGRKGCFGSLSCVWLVSCATFTLLHNCRRWEESLMPLSSSIWNHNHTVSRAFVTVFRLPGPLDSHLSWRQGDPGKFYWEPPPGLVSRLIGDSQKKERVLS